MCIRDSLDALTLPLSARKMFGEYALYLDGKVVALVCDDLPVSYTHLTLPTSDLV